jgi:transcription elongation factor GreA
MRIRAYRCEVITMQAEREVILTARGLKKIADELDELRTVHRKRVADRIREAMHFGEMGENPEFDEAKNEQAFVEGRIDELRQILAIARVLEGDEIQTDTVSVGSVVRVKDLENSDEWEWNIVGTVEADPAENRISNESPVGQALMDLKVGEVAEIEIPAGLARYQILEIRK